MPTTRSTHLASAGSANDQLGANGLLWCALIATVTGGTSWAAVDLLALSREQFLVPYVLSSAILALAFVTRERVDLRAAVCAHPLRAVIVASIAAALMIGTVMLQPGAPRAQGLRLAFELLWDGVAYGATDGALLTVIPIAAMQLAGTAKGWKLDARALLASVAVFVVYHLGFPEFRGAALVAPVVAGLVFGLTYLTSRNPLAPIAAHAAMHVAAVLHGPAGTVQLPPHY